MKSQNVLKFGMLTFSILICILKYGKLNYIYDEIIHFHMIIFTMSLTLIVLYYISNTNIENIIESLLYTFIIMMTSYYFGSKIYVNFKSIKIGTVL